MRMRSGGPGRNVDARRGLGAQRRTPDTPGDEERFGPGRVSEGRLPLQVTPKGVIGSLAVFVVAAFCIRLGFWQLDRLDQRQDANAALAERMDADPVSLTGTVADTAGLRYRRVETTGTWDGARSIVLPGRAYRGVPGAYILTPLRLGDGSAILVNRGWAGAADGATVPPELFDVSGSGRVTGIVDAFPGRGQSLAARAATAAADTFRRVWFAIDEPALRGQFPYPLVDVIVRQTPAADVPERPIRLEPPVLDEGPHLGYAIQWFSFAVIAVVGWIAMLLRRERG